MWLNVEGGKPEEVLAEAAQTWLQVLELTSSHCCWVTVNRGLLLWASLSDQRCFYWFLVFRSRDVQESGTLPELSWEGGTELMAINRIRFHYRVWSQYHEHIMTQFLGSHHFKDKRHRSSVINMMDVSLCQQDRTCFYFYAFIVVKSKYLSLKSYFLKKIDILPKTCNFMSQKQQQQQKKDSIQLPIIGKSKNFTKFWLNLILHHHRFKL